MSTLKTAPMKSGTTHESTDLLLMHDQQLLMKETI